ncbi:MAG: SWIM zinc finger domain-containing protein [Candidatus Binatia bacterium]
MSGGILDRALLSRMAGQRTYGRGVDYFEGGLVRSLAAHDGTVTATVRGTRSYRVKLWMDDRTLGYSCTCPVGVEGTFCKHAVAVGLDWLAENAGGKARKDRTKQRSVTMDDVRAHLDRQDKTALVKLLLDHAMDDDRLRERLLMRTAREGKKGINLETFRKAIDHAIEPGEFVDYHSMYEYTRGIMEIIDSIADLLKDGHAAEVVELTEHGISAVEDCLGSVDDSDGHLGGILEQLQELHHRACRKAKLDPITLAERLFAWELRTDWDVFYGAAATYKDALGKQGLARYRQLAEDEWARVPALSARSKDTDRYSKRFRITHIMETLAQATGDVDVLIAVKSRDLSHAYAYLQIAETLRAAGRLDEGLEWAERGVKAFPERTDSRLREFLADEYHRRRRHDDAMNLIWAAYMEAPHLEHYKKLKKHADQNTEWPRWRDKALAFLRTEIARRREEGSKRAAPWWSARIDNSDLVSIFLWEKNAKTAWQEANDGGCSNDLWMRLAGLREKQYPEDAIPIYQRQLEATINQKNNDAYNEAVTLLRKVQRLMSRGDKQPAFAAYLTTVRTAHKLKRNFIKLLDTAKWDG